MCRAVANWRYSEPSSYRSATGCASSRRPSRARWQPHAPPGRSSTTGCHVRSTAHCGAPCTRRAQTRTPSPRRRSWQKPASSRGRRRESRGSTKATTGSPSGDGGSPKPPSPPSQPTAPRWRASSERTPRSTSTRSTTPTSTCRSWHSTSPMAISDSGDPTRSAQPLTQGDIDALAAAYSIPAVRLNPHPGPAIEER